MKSNDLKLVPKTGSFKDYVQVTNIWWIHHVSISAKITFPTAKLYIITDHFGKQINSRTERIKSWNVRKPLVRQNCIPLKYYSIEWYTQQCLQHNRDMVQLEVSSSLPLQTHNKKTLDSGRRVLLSVIIFCSRWDLKCICAASPHLHASFFFFFVTMTKSGSAASFTCNLE